MAIVRYPHVPLADRMRELRHDMTAYEAAFVVLAETLAVPLVSCDARLAQLLRLLGPLLTPGEAELAVGLQLFAEHEGLGMFDAVLAATAMAAGAVGLVSADRAFAGVRGLTYLDLAGPDVRRLCGV